MTTSNDSWSTPEGVRALAAEVERDPVEMCLEQIHLFRRALAKTGSR